MAVVESSFRALSDIDRRLLYAADRTDIGLWVLEKCGPALSLSEAALRLHGLPSAASRITLKSFCAAIHSDDREAVETALGNGLRSGTPFSLRYRTGGGDTPSDWVELTSAGHSDEGAGAACHGSCRRITDRVRTEGDLRRRIAQHKGVEELGTFALRQDDLQEVMDRAVAIAADIFDVPLTKILQFEGAADALTLKAGVGWAEGLVGKARVGVEMETQAGYTLASDHPIIVDDLKTETRFDGPPLLHEHGVRSGMSVIIAGAGTRPFGVFGIHATDVRVFDELDVETLTALANIVANSARQAEARAQNRLLMSEMAHRAGNLLQLVSAIANQTFGAMADPKSAQEAFRERLAALSRANDLITRSGWSPTRLHDIVDQTLQTFSSRVDVSGRDILLPPELCFDLGLVLHELATNSAKYGTLAGDTGTVELRWSLGQPKDGKRAFMLEWRDGHPSDSSQGTGRGFGSRLKRALIEQKWGGAITVETGRGYTFRCEIPVPS